MEMLLKLMLYIGPVAIVICVIMALKGTRARQIEDCPPWLVNSIMDANGPERKWNLK